jgi:V8-like Glu-specific endopeptidase
MATPVSPDALRQEIEQFLDQDAYNEALTRLRDYLSAIGSPLRDAVGQQTARYNRLRKDEVNHKIGVPDAEVIRAQIRAAILGILDLAMDAPVPGVPPGLADVKVPDEVRLEEIIGSDNLQRIAWLEQGLNVAKSVCRIVAPGDNNGTGFLIAPGILMTNNHVIPSAQVAAASFAEFNYQQAVDGRLLRTHRYRLNPDHFRTSPVQYLDYTIVGILPEQGKPALEKWGSLRLNPDDLPVPSEHVVIIQHPGGGPKQIALTANQVVQTLEHRLHYTTDTIRGSSGAPVFSERWEVVALHHGSVGLQGNQRGDKRFVNEGILLSAIRADAGEMWPT